jgi:hypothetical protein
MDGDISQLSLSKDAYKSSRTKLNGPPKFCQESMAGGPTIEGQTGRIPVAHHVTQRGNARQVVSLLGVERRDAHVSKAEAVKKAYRATKKKHEGFS